MTALFNFQGMLVVIVLLICTSSYLKPSAPSYFNPREKGFKGMLGKCAVVGDRLSPYVAIACVALACTTLFIR